MATPPRSPFASPSFTDPVSGPSLTPDLLGSRQPRAKTPPIPGRPSAAFIGISWLALVTATVAFLTGLYNASMSLSAKGFYLTLLMYGLFSAVALQKAVRDRLENIPVSPLFLGLSWASVGAVVVLLTVGLWNADLLRSEQGFYAMSFLLSMFAAVAVQKNVRDVAAAQAQADGSATETDRD